MPQVIAEVAIPISIALNEQFDYLVPKELTAHVAVGCRVLVPFRTSVILGYVVGLKKHSAFADKLKSILKNLDNKPVLDEELLSLAYKIKEDYFCSLADAIGVILPHGLKKTLKPFVSEDIKLIQSIPVFDLTRDDTTLLERDEWKSLHVLIEDLSNKKRWSVYASLIKKTLNEKKSVIFLVPDHEKIASSIEFLNSGVVPYILSSRLSAQESIRSWVSIKASDFSFCIGTRSAVFAPVNNLGLIIIEEEDHFAYRQDQVPHYRTFEIAEKRTKDHNAKLILGGFPLSVDARYHFAKQDFSCLRLDRSDAWPLVKIIDMRNEFRKKGKEKIISKILEYHLANALGRKEKVLIFTHHKGFSTFLYCQKCHTVQTCPRCSSSLRYHFKEKFLLCPTCSFQTDSYDICPNCRSSYVKYSGYGLEKVESEIARLFPAVKINTYEKSNAPASGYDIMLATQQFLEDPYISRYQFDAVFLLSCDRMFGHADFRSTERTFARLLRLLLCAKKEICLQTYMVDNDALKYLADARIDEFIKHEYGQRKDLKLPPAIDIGVLIMRSHDQEKAKEHAQKCYEKLKAEQVACEIFEPVAATPFKVRGNYRFQILIKYKKLDKIKDLIRGIIKERKQEVITTFDPSPL
jgi:primosomal protein N' (replication factor Y)